jgi:hypothetical protein
LSSQLEKTKEDIKKMANKLDDMILEINHPNFIARPSEIQPDQEAQQINPINEGSYVEPLSFVSRFLQELNNGVILKSLKTAVLFLLLVLMLINVTEIFGATGLFRVCFLFAVILPLISTFLNLKQNNIEEIKYECLYWTGFSCILLLDVFYCRNNLPLFIYLAIKFTVEFIWFKNTQGCEFGLALHLFLRLCGSLLFFINF